MPDGAEKKHDAEDTWLAVAAPEEATELDGSGRTVEQLHVPAAEGAEDKSTEVMENTEPARPKGFKRLRQAVTTRLRAMNTVVDVPRVSDANSGVETGPEEAAQSPAAGHAHQLAALLNRWQGGVSVLLPDARWRRYWDMMTLLGAWYHGVTVPLVLVGSLGMEPLAPPGAALSAVWILDALIRSRTAFVDDSEQLVTDPRLVRAHYWHRWAAIDAASAPPFDSIAAWAGLHTGVVRAVSALRLLRLLHVLHVFGRSNLAVMTAGYVSFNFNVAPQIIRVFWGTLMLHLLVSLKLAVAAGGADDGDDTDSRYDYALFWVWNLLTTSPAPLTLNSYAQRVLCFILMICGVFFQGIVISKLSYWTLKQSIQEENIECIRATLSALQQYRVPPALQQEVLSLQWHVLQSSLNAISRSAVLESLPPVMRNELLMYMKIDFVEKVPMFRSAPHRTKILLAGSLNQVVFQPSETIITKGDIGHEMYFILHGYCDVEIPAVGSVGQLTRGQYFGEVALLTSEPRGATIRALTYCECLSLHKSDFEAVCQENADFAREITAEADKRAGKQGNNRRPSAALSGRCVTGASTSQGPSIRETEWQQGPSMRETERESAPETPPEHTKAVADSELVKRMASFQVKREQQERDQPLHALVYTLNVLEDRHRMRSQPSANQHNVAGQSSAASLSEKDCRSAAEAADDPGGALGRARASAGPEMVPQISLMHPSSCRTERKHPAHPAALHRVQGSSALSLGTLSTSCGRAARLSQAENTSPRPEPHRAGMLCGDMLHTESFTQLPPALAGSGPLPERLAPSSPVGRVNASPGFHEEPLTPGTPPTAEQPTSTKHAHINEADAEPHGIHRLLSTGTECAREVGDQSAQLACILNEVRRANAGVEELRREVQECRAEMQEVRVLCEVQARAHTSAMATRFSVQSRESNASQGHLSPSHVPRVFGMQRNPLQPAQGGLSRFTSFRFR
eukprot:TRINITY_DN314_c0_g1_i3.p1 TRINITY_DN314_c0_g1~~TRINITY_DN314_c0_g1_i3.p1  ORF type:complete len:995 (+),score=233.60 TRINITY_DN314_c0_g1_i3:81-2987(+)